MEFKDILEAYKQGSDLIFNSFGLKNGYGEIDIMDDVKWTCDESEVRWLNKDCLYSNEIMRGPWEHQNYMLFYVDNGCGEKYYQIFDKNLMDENIEDD